MPGRDQTILGPTKIAPVWCQDFLDRDHLIPGGAKADAAQFFAADAVLVTVAPAGAAAAATSVPVLALPGAIPNGTLLDFGTNKFARLTAAAAAGAVTLTTSAIPTALVSLDTARYAGLKPRGLAGGTIVGRTFAERDASTPYGPAAAADDEVLIVAFDVSDLTRINDIELVRPNTVIKENFLPGITGIAAGVLTKLRDKYVVIRGSE